jgi:hypothetical protein
MKAYVFVTRRKNDEGYTNTSFNLQGVGLNGRIPVRVVYFGKPVLEPIPVLVKQIDKATGKPVYGKDGKEVLIEKLDEQGNVIFEKDENGNIVYVTVKNEKGQEVLRDDQYRARIDVLSMFATEDDDISEVCMPVDIIKKPCKERKNGDKFWYYVICGDDRIPVEVVDFSTEERPDYSYESNRRKLYALATQE